jgi:hypothetical protein
MCLEGACTAHEHVYTTWSSAVPGRVYTTWGPELHLYMSGSQELAVLLLDVSTPQERELYLDVYRQQACEQACAGLGLSTLQAGYIGLG